ncbi:MAG: hypothetical protein J6R59_01950 [Paludibacteraceae bacterium]|nr:hypothetical protein [Paludibacteraceae bacterium]
MKMINAFKNLIAVDVLSGDCKLVVNGFIAKRVTDREIVVNMTDGAGEGYDTRYFNLNALQKVTLLPEKTKFSCVFANRWRPERPDIVEIEVVKSVNFKGWIFDTDEDV